MLSVSVIWWTAAAGLLALATEGTDDFPAFDGARLSLRDANSTLDQQHQTSK